MNGSLTTSSSTIDIYPIAPNVTDVLPTLIGAYQDHSYEVGYARGRSDVRIALLESAQEFSSLRHEASADVQRLIYEFADFVEQRIRNPAHATHSDLIGGLGI